MGSALILLLDTATLLWATSQPFLLSAGARDAIEDTDNEIFVSTASAWEIATKYRRGRLDQARPLVVAWDDELDRMGYARLDITAAHGLLGGGYEVDHGDPFDRIIAAQTELEGMTLVASDRSFDLFPVRRLW